MNKLISMVDYVNRLQGMIEPQSVTIQIDIHASKYNLICDYAKFLSQPLELGMFVPCDKEGNVLHGFSARDHCKQNKRYKQYQEAKDRVIFEGFSLSPLSNGVLFDNKGNGVIIEIEELIKINLIIESLIIHLNLDLTLTPSKAKELGL